MNSFFFLLHLLLSSSNPAISGANDTCQVHKVPIDTLFREVNYYKSYYEEFTNDSISDYQVININMPLDDAPGSVLYYKSQNNSGVFNWKSGPDIKRANIDHKKNDLFKCQLDKVENGGYVCICDLDNMNIVYSVCIVKKGREVIFQYQGVNKNILSLKNENETKLEVIISLLHSLRSLKEI
ncbi:hypothetical protein [Chitinophaga sp. GbtcB8]|uniref:hypothetical protein n=1 Tax=Chitinophaga sp. GbtcB8 TaxID=2824753 RepID=UPI001C30DA73|nr:hypothetical protein [Chitinophaga sp. GbtcB8]